jgi:hypothetical protein
MRLRVLAWVVDTAPPFAKLLPPLPSREEVPTLSPQQLVALDALLITALMGALVAENPPAPPAWVEPPSVDKRSGDVVRSLADRILQPSAKGSSEDPALDREVMIELLTRLWQLRPAPPSLP